MKALAQRATEIGTETAFETLARARALEGEGRRIVHLEIGEPDFPTPGHIVRAGQQALDDGATKYVQAAGIPELRAAVAEHVAESRGVAVDPAQVIITPGGKPILFFTVLALVEPGDEVILPDPGFPIYESAVRFAGGRPVPLPLREENDFRPSVDDLARLAGPRTKLIVWNSPGNPCGNVSTREELAAVAALARRHDAWVLSDEIYRRIAYDGPAPSLYTVPGAAERTVLLDGFSKTYAMTGWRLGFGVFPPALTEAVTRLVTNSVSCVPAFVQRAGIAALQGPQQPVDRMVAAFRERRDRFVEALRQAGLRCTVPAGAFYAFANVGTMGESCAAVAERLLQGAGVAALAGTCFGAAGEGYVRFSYAASLADLDEAVDRLRQEWAP